MEINQIASKKMCAGLSVDYNLVFIVQFKLNSCLGAQINTIESACSMFSRFFGIRFMQLKTY